MLAYVAVFTVGTALAHALKKVGREDVVRQSMQNISLVQNDTELAHALSSIDAVDGAKVHEPPPPPPSPPARVAEEKAEEEEASVKPVDDGVLEAEIAPAVELPPEHHEESMVRSEEEKKAALEALVNQMQEDNLELPDTTVPAEASGDDGKACTSE